MRQTFIRRWAVTLKRGALAGVAAITLTACSGQASTAPSANELVLEHVPDNTACDAIGVDYTSVTFHIDLAASRQVWAVTDKGRSLSVWWGSAFSGGGTGAKPVVVDASGAVVVGNGDSLALPKAAWPNLHGHMACPGSTSLIILNEAPA